MALLISQFLKMDKFKVFLRPGAGDDKVVDLEISKVEWANDDLLLVRGMKSKVKSLADQLSVALPTYSGGDKGLAHWLVITIDDIETPAPLPQNRRHGGGMDPYVGGNFSPDFLADMMPSQPKEEPVGNEKPGRIWAVMFEKVVDLGFTVLDTAQKVGAMEMVKLVRAELIDAGKMKLKTKSMET